MISKVLLLISLVVNIAISCSANAMTATEYISMITEDELYAYIRQDNAFATRFLKISKVLHTENNKASIIPELEAMVEESASISPAVHANLLALLAQSYGLQYTPQQYLDTLNRLKNTDAFTGEQADEVAFLVDVDISRFLLNTLSKKEDLGTAMAELDASYEHLFSTYTPYRYEILNAHNDYAMRAYSAASQLRDDHYYLVAWEHLQEMRRIALELKGNPSLAGDERAASNTDRFLKYYDEQWYYLEKYAKHVLRGGTEDDLAVTPEMMDDPAIPEIVRDGWKKSLASAKERLQKDLEKYAALDAERAAEQVKSAQAVTGTATPVSETNTLPSSNAAEAPADAEIAIIKPGMLRMIFLGVAGVALAVLIVAVAMKTHKRNAVESGGK